MPRQDLTVRPEFPRKHPRQRRIAAMDKPAIERTRSETVMHGGNEYIVEVERSIGNRGELLDSWKALISTFPTREVTIPSFHVRAVNVDDAFAQAVNALRNKS